MYHVVSVPMLAIHNRIPRIYLTISIGVAPGLRIQYNLRRGTGFQPEQCCCSVLDLWKVVSLNDKVRYLSHRARDSALTLVMTSLIGGTPNAETKFPPTGRIGVNNVDVIFSSPAQSQPPGVSGQHQITHLSTIIQ